MDIIENQNCASMTSTTDGSYQASDTFQVGDPYPPEDIYGPGLHNEIPNVSETQETQLTGTAK